MSAATTRLGGAASRHLAAAGPWPAGRILRAVPALGLAGALTALPAGVDPRVAPLLALPAFAGFVVLAVALARGRTGSLGAAVALLGVPAAVTVASAPVVTAATAGAALVAVHELSRWSVERRVEPPSRRAGEARRWAHLALVLGAGWLAGVGVVVLASGRVRVAAWHVLLAALAAVLIALTVTALARSRTQGRAQARRGGVRG